MCYNNRMPRETTQRQLRNASGEVMRALDAGVSFLLTRNGVPVGELTPFERRGFVPKASVLAAFKRAARVDLSQLRKDLDALAKQDPAPRG